MSVATEEALEAAHAGAAFLDEKLSPDWRARIDPDRLDISCGDFIREDSTSCGCILAQLYQHFTTGMGQVGLFDDGLSGGGRLEQAKRLGFLERYGDPQGALEEAWRVVLAEGPA